MTYQEFLTRQKEFIGKVAEFTTTFKAINKTMTIQRKIYNENCFAPLKEDSLITISKVKVI